MPTDKPTDSHQLPERPDLRHLKNQARDLVRSGAAKSVAEAQFEIARRYGFASWPKLKAHVEAITEIGQLKKAIDTNDLARVKNLMTRNPSLHTAPLGYARNGPLTWVAECRVPWGPPSKARLEIAKWMIENGSDVHQGADGPLGRAALNGQRIAMMELLVSYGADVNAEWAGHFPMIFSPCESVDPVALQWLIDHGADPNCSNSQARQTALDYLIGSYVRTEELARCIDILLAAGGTTKYDIPAVLDILRGDIDKLSGHLREDRSLIKTRFEGLDFGVTAERMLTLQGSTLLHVAAEYGNLEAVGLLLESGADVNARSDVDQNGVGGQTPIFHSATQVDDRGFEVSQLLISKGADLAVRAKIPGHYERPGEVVECTPLGYALRFPGIEGKTVELLRKHGAIE